MAVKYFMNGGVDSLWGSDTNWSTTSSAGPNNTTAPAASDEIILDSGSPTCTLGAATATIKSINFTGYTATFAFGAFVLNVGDGLTCFITFASGMAATGTGAIHCLSSLTITWNGFTLPVGLALRGGSQTYTMADAGIVTGGLTCWATTAATLNGSTLNVSGGLTQNGGDFGGNTTLTLSGGTWSKPGGGIQTISMTIAGNVTISPTNGPSFKTGTLTYSSGTVTTTGSTLTISDTCTLNTNGITWNIVSLSANPTVTLNSLLSAASISVAATSNPVFAGTAGFTLSGDLTGAKVTSGTRTVTLQYAAASPPTYTVGSITLSGTNDTNAYREIKSSSAVAGERALLTVTNGAGLSFVRATRINSSSGTTVQTTGTVTDSINWTQGVMWAFS